MGCCGLRTTAAQIHWRCVCGGYSPLWTADNRRSDTLSRATSSSPNCCGLRTIAAQIHSSVFPYVRLAAVDCGQSPLRYTAASFAAMRRRGCGLRTIAAQIHYVPEPLADAYRCGLRTIAAQIHLSVNRSA